MGLAVLHNDYILLISFLTYRKIFQLFYMIRRLGGTLLINSPLLILHLDLTLLFLLAAPATASTEAYQECQDKHCEEGH